MGARKSDENLWEAESQMRFCGRQGETTTKHRSPVSRVASQEGRAAPGEKKANEARPQKAKKKKQ